MKEHIIKFFTYKWTFPIILFVVGIIITLQNIHMGIWEYNRKEYTHYNNYIIFKYSYSHLVQCTNLYSSYPDQYADLYKYSPTFAFFMGPFAKLPDTAGLLIWNLLNIFVLFFAIIKLKLLNQQTKILLLLFVAFELILSAENSQSNALLAGLMIMSFNLLEKDKPVMATFFIALGAFIKVYSLVGCLLLLLYPNKIKSALSLLLWGLLLFALPLCVVDIPDLISQYKNWYLLIRMDETISLGISIYLYMDLFFSADSVKPVTQCIAFILLLAPLLLRKLYTDFLFRTLYLSLILIWIVVFNHKAESPTYVIAMCGIGIWYFYSEKKRLYTILVLASLFFTSLWFTDLVPRNYKDVLGDHMYLKPLFPTMILLVIMYTLFHRYYTLKAKDLV
ncbi:MAG: glycosyltransferase family 87 protein [Bacteroidota bacterium]